MARYWAIAPYESKRASIWEKVWQYDLANNTIAIGWNEAGDVSKYDETQLRSVIEKEYAHKTKGSKTRLFNTMWQFYNGITEGDIVMGRRGRRQIAAIGTVIQTAYYDPAKGKERVGKDIDDFNAHFIGVQWHDQPRELNFMDMVFPIQTMSEVSADKYQILLKENGEDKEEQNKFVLEKYLEAFIVSNFDRIFGGNLVLFVDGEGNNGQQYSTGVGDIDILAKKTNTDSFVVIELKRGRESDKVVGQILRYMGWVKENLCDGDQGVEGLIICKEANDKLTYALKMTNDIELRCYEVDFRLI